ncbi:MAG: hypothetical protein ACD_44C00325G0001 [uncultured bacterium]|nr:MAG: hypothetical protein ACD_44C00325G0001 [uncultured bacterium]OGT16639.1 MAG: hypothetical protein A3B69_03355 [Gammaproteobacteria bacterium RIFCSPHIGHO2_02_FULL_38_33]OGT23732.1 MAG: hypothetical protein A2W47_04775 [Gammaproteobacteria bacterium RIFCSPHIGHO2_12_38_15]OGT67816.1 MAG: hypothetical protein A3I12_01855 [Gammaproteobacteria bacterium RIFCSPLOWO2_02_FULL_38_11]
MFKKIKQFIVPAFLISFSASAQAVYPGPYVGLIAGESYTNYTASNTGLSSANINNQGLGGGIFAGYQFNLNFSAEINYIRFTNTKFSNINGTNGPAGRVVEDAYELFLKGICPVSNNGFNVSAKVGIAYINATASHAIFDNNSEAPNESRGAFTYGVGFGYDVTPTVPVEISWTRVQNSGNLQNADLAGLSVSYFFG